MACPDDYLKGIITIRGGVGVNDLKDITVKTHPFVANFQPRSIPLTLIQNNIEESFDNTILYKGNMYHITNPVQVCSPVHTGYLFDNSQEASLELIIPFQYSGNDSGTYPNGIFVCFPIYESSVQNNAQYLNQFTGGVIHSIASLFTTGTVNSNNSMSYQSCFEIANSKTNKIIGNSTFLTFVFTKGIQMLPKNLQALITKISIQKQIPRFKIPAPLRNHSPTVYLFSFDDNGNKIVNSVSNDGYIYNQTIPSGTTEFSNRFQYFIYPPKLKSSKTTDKKTSCGVSQYKCVPMEMLRNNLTLSDISTGKSIDDIYKQREDTQNDIIQEDNNTSSSIDPQTIEYIVGGTVGVVGVVIFGLFVEYLIVKLSKQ